MNEEPVKAWQPLTFGGVARYGQDWVGRVFFAAIVVAILSASTVVWTASRAWFPVIGEAIAKLPAGAEIRGGKLTAPQAIGLAENLFLSFRLDPQGEGAPASLADIQVVLAPNEVRFRSLFGAARLPYQPEWTIPLNRNELEPKWEAWRPALLAYSFFGVIIELFVSWIALAIIYAIPVRLFAAAVHRRVSLWGAWKLSMAGLLPGAILLTVAIAIYGLGQIRLLELTFTWALHFVAGWIFIIGATFSLPRKTGATNPFGNKSSESETEEEDEEKNPFKSSKKGHQPAEKNPFKRNSRKK
jgi:hypothetical protein